MSIFSTIRVPNPKKNLFNLSHEVKLTADFGQLIPFYTEICYPGDTFKVSSEALVKTMPLLAPIMHRVNMYMHFFEVPMRLLIPDWDRFISGVDEQTREKVNMNTPQFILKGEYSDYIEDFGASSLIDYLGFPTPDEVNYQEANQLQMSVPKFIVNAYNKIWNDYYRDENQDDEIPLDLNVGNTVVSSKLGPADYRRFAIQTRCWAKDYFTSALPDAQQGPEVTLPLGDAAPLNGFVTVHTGLQPTSGDVPVYAQGASFSPTDPHDERLVSAPNGGTATPIQFSINGEADLSQASGVTINDLRMHVKVQQWLERQARAGYRYVEQLFGHFGERSDDARLQRAQFLGGGKLPVVISEVLQQSQSSESSPQGNQSGHAIVAGSNFAFKRHFKEHTIVMGILSIMPIAGYMQGYPRKFAFKDKFDMYWPEFGHLGEQAVKNQEIFYNFQSLQTVNDGDFGYQSRYAELKHNPDRVHGQFKNQNMMQWHLARFFTPNGGKPISPSSTVNLNSTFLRPDLNSMNRVFPVVESDHYLNKGHFYIQLYNNVKASRKIPRYGTPML